MLCEEERVGHFDGCFWADQELGMMFLHEADWVSSLN
jgi:hypothetical protein